MGKKRQIKELKKMVVRAIYGFKGTDKTTIEVNKRLSGMYKELCTTYNIAHGWLIK